MGLFTSPWCIVGTELEEERQQVLRSANLVCRPSYHPEHWVAITTCGLCIFLHKGGNHFRVTHEIVGLIVVIIGTLQPFNALLRNLPFVGHPKPDGTRTLARLLWEVLHKGCGYIAVLLGMINVVLGPIHAHNLKYSSVLTITAAVFIGISLSTLIIGGIVMELLRQFGYDCFDSQGVTDKKTIGGSDDA